MRCCNFNASYFLTLNVNFSFSFFISLLSQYYVYNAIFQLPRPSPLCIAMLYGHVQTNWFRFAWIVLQHDIKCLHSYLFTFKPSPGIARVSCAFLFLHEEYKHSMHIPDADGARCSHLFLFWPCVSNNPKVISTSFGSEWKELLWCNIPDILGAQAK